MAPTQNLALIFNSVPTHYPEPGKHLVVKDIGFDASAPCPSNGLVLETLYLSYDPYIRGLLRAPEVKSYFPALPLHSPLVNVGLAKVLQSNLPAYSEGDILLTRLPFVQYAVLTASDIESLGQPEKVDLQAGPPDLRDWLGAVGMPGLTAYSSLYEIGKPKRGETIFVSAASGAVGQIVGQLAKREGLRVIGSVGSDEKLEFITGEIGYDGGWNYKKEGTDEALGRLAPSGVDIYYDNVGGEQLSTAIAHMNDHGRIVACGQISQYNLPVEEQYGIKNTLEIVGKRLTMRGFIVTDEDMGPKYEQEFRKNVSQWLRDRSMKSVIAETVGMEKSAEGFVDMLKGGNFGKAVLKVNV